MGGKSSAPASPDYIAAAREQGNQNILAALASAALSTPNVNSPYGSVSWQYTGGGQGPGAQPGTTPGATSGAGSLPPGMQGFLDRIAPNLRFSSGTGTPAPSGGPVGLSPGDYTMNVQLSPEQQRLFDAQTGVQRLASQYLGSGAQNAFDAQQRGLDFTGLPQLPTGGVDTSQLPALPSNLPDLYGNLSSFTDPNAMRTRVEDALYGRMTRNLDPRFEQAEEALLSRLANQGLAPGSEAYNRELEQFRRTKDMAYQDATDRSIEGGTAEAARIFGQDLATRDQLFGENLSGRQQLFGEGSSARDQLFREAMGASTTNFGQALSGRQQGLDEQLLAQSNPLTQLMQLMQLSQPTMPGQMAGGGQGIAAAPYFDAVNQQYQNQLMNWQSRNQTQQANLMGLAQMGTSIAPYAAKALMSDARAKRKIERIGMFRGFPAYRYEYLDGTPSVGVLAQEVMVTRPDAVILGDDGFLRVNYGAL